MPTPKPRAIARQLWKPFLQQQQGGISSKTRSDIIRTLSTLMEPQQAARIESDAWAELRRTTPQTPQRYLTLILAMTHPAATPSAVNGASDAITPPMTIDTWDAIFEATRPTGAEALLQYTALSAQQHNLDDTPSGTHGLGQITCRRCRIGIIRTVTAQMRSADEGETELHWCTNPTCTLARTGEAT